MDTVKQIPNFAAKNRFFAILIAVVVIAGLYALAEREAQLNVLSFRFNPYALISLTTLVINLGLALYLGRRTARTEERVWLMVYLVGLCVYALGEILQRLSATPQAAGFWGLLSVAGGGIPVGLYLFALSYTNQSQRHFPGTVAVLFTASIALAFFYDHTSLLLPQDWSHAVYYPWGYNVLAQKGEIFAVLWYDGLVITTLVRLFSFRRHTSNPILRQQSLIFILATFIPIVLGTTTDAILPIMGVTSLPPLAMAMFTPAAILLIYGVMRYQLLTINPTLFSNEVLTVVQESIVATDGNFNIMFMNAKAEDLLGVRMGSRHFSLLKKIAEESKELFRSGLLVKDALHSKAAQFGPVDIIRTGGSSVPVRITASPMRIAGQNAWIMALVDITNELDTQRHIEHEVQVRTAELHEAQAYLLSSINSLEQGFILVNGKGKIELANGVASQMLGMNSATLKEASLQEAISSLEWNENLGDAVKKVLDAKRSHQLNTETADGSFFTIFVTPIIDGDKTLGAAVVIENVTEQKIRDRSKDEFFSIASHELRTPLTAIRGNMSMVKDYFPDAMKDDGLATMIDDTHAASVRLIEIVNDFLDSSALEQGKMKFQLEDRDVKPMILAVANDLKPLIDDRHDTVEMIGLDSLPQIKVDEGRFRQIMYNLLSNAVKYSENSLVTVTGKHVGSSVKISVIDTGKGISPEGQKLLFHKFQQAGASMLTRDNTKGTGLGLYISRLLAQNMHGTVELEKTEVGKGSTFTVILPVARTKTNEDTARKAETNSRR